MINESLKNAFKEMWKKNLNLLDISKSDLNSHISNDHPCHYAESASIGGPASSAVKLNSSAGDSNTPVYFSGGRPVACTSLDLNTSGNAAKATALTTSAGSATNPIYFSEGKPAACAYTLGKSVPSDAKFTDTTYTSLKNPYALTIQGNGTTLTNGTYDGSAAKTVNITPASIGAATSGHTHNYAGSSSAGGSATSAVKLDSSAGSATQPIYFSNGKPAACTYTLGKSVPSDAKFTDTTYNNATTSTDGLMSSSDKTKLNGIAAGATKTIVDSALSSTSTNPVQNKIIYGAISSKADLNTSGKVLSS